MVLVATVVRVAEKGEEMVDAAAVMEVEGKTFFLPRLCTQLLSNLQHAAPRTHGTAARLPCLARTLTLTLLRM